MNKSTWVHGFQQRTILDTDTERVRQIMNEGRIIKVSTLDKAISLENSINPADQLKPYKLNIIKSVLRGMTSNKDEDIKTAEQSIKSILSMYPKLSSYVSHIRQQLSC
jgi:hypothetical protein